MSNIIQGTITAASTLPSSSVLYNGYPNSTTPYSSIGIYGAGVGIGAQVPSTFSLHNQGKEIVRINPDGTVTWHDQIDIDAAAAAFCQSLRIGAEMSAGINKRVKLEMRDSIFSDLIDIARSKGSLTADDLTYLLQASKIVEKLKGSNE